MKTLSTNKRAHFDYEIVDTIEAGIILTGPEVKSAKSGALSIKEAHAVITNGELWLLNAYIQPYNKAKNNEAPDRSRKLLIKKKEIDKLIGKAEQKGYTIVPTKAYEKRGLIKIEIGLGKGKKQYEKKEVKKQKDIDRDVQRELRGDKSRV